MNERDFYNVSIRGMVAYCIMCLESYVLEAYPNRGFVPILQLAWEIVGPDGYIDQKADHFMECIPEYLFEFDSYEEAEFEHLTKEEFDEFRILLEPDDETLNLVMHRVYDVAMGYAYTAVPTPPKEAVDLVWEVVRRLNKQRIPLPNFELVRTFSFSEHDGWGTHISPKSLSRVL